MKKIILVCGFAIIMGLTWFDLLYTDAQIITNQVPNVGVNPEKAIISTVVIGVTGLAIFLWRRKKEMKKEDRK